MTTKMHQRVTSVLAGIAIAVLLAIIIVVWVQVGHGAFRPKYHQYNVNTSVDENAQGDYPDVVKSNLARYKENKKKDILESSHLEDLGKDTDTEFVKPMKISPPPLHDHDIIYDQLHNTQDHPPLRHHSGHFRHKTAEVWDPHPQYEIDAFGKKLQLDLTFNDKFVAPNLQVTHVWENYTRKAMHDPKTSGCFYTGKVKGEESSDIAVSLCNGMTGNIRTSEGYYYIEPVEKFQNGSVASILHRIQKIEHKTGILDNDIQGVVDSDLCETRENSTVIDDHFPVSGIEDEHEHLITKRDLRFDYLDTSQDIEDYTELMYEKRRSTRDVPWADKTLEFAPRRKRTGNQEYHIETMVVADKKMAQYHNTDEDLIHYILTLMSHVALLYKDATIGNPISLAVVKIWILKDTEFTSTTSEEMLRKFCEWQAQFNTKHQHDVALLLTRDSICKNSTAQLCNTLGVAEVSSMCSPTSSCAIVKDKGLSTSYTIAHELGHVLSMPHDDDRRCPIFNGGLKANNIMSKVLQNDTKPWLWSPCSKHFATEFLESNRASCLFNTPNNDFITSKFVKILPGETFEVDRQCELEFGKGYKLCPYAEMAMCGSLWCTTDDLEGCKTQHMPWADGTLCAELSWCHHGECIAQDRNLLQPIPGGWGEWQEWGPCSRTCGGGVRVAKRACDSPLPLNGGAYCTGRSVKYTSCNYQPCDADAPEFREAQCSEFNGFKGVPGLEDDVEWVPKYGLNDPDDLCKLYCRLKHSPSYYMLKRKVVDGTKCGLNTFDICVSGICRPAGCDNRLESKAVLDECGVCGGDNSKCEEISGTYNISSGSSSSSYKRVVRIPKGSSNVYILQRGYGNSSADDNYLALVDGETGVYVLNGNFRISPFLKDVIFGGMTITYSGSEAVVEYIKTPKNRKLTKDLVLEVLSVGKQLPPDISYRYTIRRDSAPRYVNAPRYGWQLYEQQWTKCNSLCNGKQYMRPHCVELTTSTRVPDTYCSDLDMDSLVQQKDCNIHCRFAWNVHSRGHCSSQCGKGVRPIVYNCVRIDVNEEQSTTHNYRMVVNDKHCSLLPKPSEVEPCEGHCESTRWEYDEWSKCTKTCGGGTQRRNAKCLDKNYQIISDAQCNENERVVEQICNNQKCPSWSFDDWTPCSVTCGKGYRTRPYYCHVDGLSYNTDACDPKLLPVLKEECNERPCVVWSTGKWGDCNVTCGEGMQEREVVCRTFDSIVVENEHCNDILKPNSTRSCFRDKCEELASIKREYDISSNDVEDDNYIIPPPKKNLKFKWVTGAWSKCTKACETGTKSRMVVCRNVFGEENEHECDRHEKPIQSVECNTHVCPTWNFGAWSTCDLNCEQHRQVSCQSATGDIIEDQQCDMNSKPYGSTKCNTEHCIRGAATNLNNLSNDRRDYYNVKENREKQYKWEFGRWGRCSKSCGKGTKTRSIRCFDIVNNVTVVDQYCNHLKKPKLSKSCEKNNCDYVWVEGVWSQCSQTCGKGFKHRNVSCHKVLHGGYVDPTPLPEVSYNMIHHNYCDVYTRPSGKSNCIDRNCNDPYSWSTGPWGQCSHTCGRKGRQIRPLYCLTRDGRKVKQRFCPKALKPRRKRKCNRKRCLYRSCKEVKHSQATISNKEYYLLVNEKPALVYCFKMDTAEPEEFISLKADRQNFAEMYDKSLHQRDSCPSFGQRRDNCDCMLIGPDRSGLTVFWKVRLNMTSLQIITDDFTFSRQIKGKKISYGTAGDCYSEQEGCIQGMFSVDLTDTSFRLSRSVRWIHNGNKATSQIDVQERMARGKCGGYCGSCLPDPNIGLAVEVT